MTIDQSVRIEETNRDTIISLADKKNKFSLRITSKIKRNFQEWFRRLGKPKIFPIILFSVAVYLLVKKSGFWPQVIIIDIEYPGHEPAIKNIILRFYRVEKNREPDIYFSNIGKKDAAHLVALAIHRGKAKADLVVSENELQRMVRFTVKK